jgi:hypothetical protein
MNKLYIILGLTSKNINDEEYDLMNPENASIGERQRWD